MTDDAARKDHLRTVPYADRRVPRTQLLGNDWGEITVSCYCGDIHKWHVTDDHVLIVDGIEVDRLADGEHDIPLPERIPVHDLAEANRHVPVIAPRSAARGHIVGDDVAERESFDTVPGASEAQRTLIGRLRRELDKAGVTVNWTLEGINDHTQPRVELVRIDYRGRGVGGSALITRAGTVLPLTHEYVDVQPTPPAEDGDDA